MSLPRRGGDWGSLAGYVLLSLFLYFLGAVDALFFLFAVPLQVLYMRRGRAQFLAASAIVLVGIGAFSVWRTASVGTGSLRLILVLVEVAAGVLIEAGVYVANTQWPSLRRRLYRLLAATLVAGIVSLPFVVMLARSAEFSTLLQNQVKQVLALLSSSFGGSSSLSSTANLSGLTAYIRQTILSNYLFAYFVILTVVWRVGTFFAMRSSLVRPAPLSAFSLPVGFLWPTLVVWGGVLASRTLHLTAFGDGVWNLAMIGAFLYGLQGVGIVQHLFARYNVARGIRFLLFIIVLFLLFIPGVATIVLLAFPVLGISELWFHFRREGQSVGGEKR